MKVTMVLVHKTTMLPGYKNIKIASSTDIHEPILEVKQVIKAKNTKNKRLYLLVIQARVIISTGNTNKLVMVMVFNIALMVVDSDCKLTNEFKIDEKPKVSIIS